MKNMLLTILSIYVFAGLSLKGDELPVNALQKSVIGNWWLLGPIEKDTPDFNVVGKIEKDPLNYFNKNDNNDLSKKIMNISSSGLFIQYFSRAKYSKNCQSMRRAKGGSHCFWLSRQ